MKELLRTNDPVRLSVVQDILAQNDIPCFEMDQYMSVLEGSIGILPRRLMVADRDLFMARAVLREAGLDD